MQVSVTRQAEDNSVNLGISSRGGNQFNSDLEGLWRSGATVHGAEDGVSDSVGEAGVNHQRDSIGNGSAICKSKRAWAAVVAEHVGKGIGQKRVPQYEEGLGCQGVGWPELVSTFVDLGGHLAQDVELGENNVSNRVGVDGGG